MRRLLMLAACMSALILVVAASGVSAQVDVEMAFDPTVASAGDQVSFFISIANLGDEAVLADISLTLSFGDMVIGPILGTIPLAAGQELSRELMLIVPAIPTGGDLVVEVTVTAGGFSDTATATLTIVGTGGGNAANGLQGLGNEIARGLSIGDQSAATDDLSFGKLKSRF